MSEGGAGARARRRASRVASCLVAALTACSAPACNDAGKPPAPAEQAALGGGIAARVGDEIIPVDLVTRVAADQHVSLEEARRRLVDDAIAAYAAKKRGRDAESPASWNLRAARARFTVDRLLVEAHAKGPPSDEEIARISNEHWQEVDRPVSVRTVHAIAVARPSDPPEKRRRAREVAEALKAAVAGAKDPDDFIARARAVPHPKDIEVVAEKLPATTKEGWVAEGGGAGQMDPRFAKAANELASPGDTTDLVESDFGFHVIRLVERVPERRMPLEARRAAFTDEAYALRARIDKDQRLKALRARTTISLEPTAEELMRAVSGAKDRGKSP